MVSSIATPRHVAGLRGGHDDAPVLGSRLHRGEPDVVPPAELQQQRRRAGRRVGGEVTVDAAFVATTSLTGHLVPAPTAGDDLGDEVSRLERDARRGVVDLGVQTADDPGQADDAAVVADDQVIGSQDAAHMVEGLERLAVRGPARAHRAPQLVHVVGVKRLPELEHDVVRDVDSERDRTHPAGDQSPLHPGRRRRRRVEADDGAHREQVAAASVVSAALLRGAVRQRSRKIREGHPRVIERQAVGNRRLPRDAADGQRVSPVRRDGDVEHLVAYADHGSGVVAGLPPCPRAAP